jgi:hypothetical protein
MEMPDTVKAELKTMAGAKGQLSRWSQGLDKYTGDLITSLFSRAQKGTLGTLSQQDADAMKAFTANMKAEAAREIAAKKTAWQPYADQYKVPEKIFNIPFTPTGQSVDVGYPGMDTHAVESLGITPGASSSDIVDGLVGDTP